METLLLHLLMGVHLVLVIVGFAAGPYIAWMAIKGKRSKLFWFTVAYPPAILVGQLFNGGECLLQSWAKQMRGIEEGWARDIYFLPEWFAHQVVLIGAILYISGMIIFLTQLARK